MSDEMPKDNRAVVSIDLRKALKALGFPDRVKVIGAFADPHQPYHIGVHIEDPEMERHADHTLEAYVAEWWTDPKRWTKQS